MNHTGTPTLGFPLVPTCVVAARMASFSVSAVSRHHAALCAVVVIVPAMETTVVRARTLSRRPICATYACCCSKNALAVLDMASMVRSCWISATYSVSRSEPRKVGGVWASTGISPIHSFYVYTML